MNCRATLAARGADVTDAPRRRVITTKTSTGMPTVPKTPNGSLTKILISSHVSFAKRANHRLTVRPQEPSYRIMNLLSRLAAGAVLVVSATALSVSRRMPRHRHKRPIRTLPLTYEAASVKPNKSGGQGSSIRRLPGGRLQATNMPLRALITFAYQLQPFQLVGIPPWIRNETFDIVAKMEGDPPPVMPGQRTGPHMVAMRTLLAERFKLAVHRETREMDIYALVLARPDGKPGPALKPTTQDCAAMMAAARGGPPPGPAPGPNSPVVCGMRGLPGRLVASAHADEPCSRTTCPGKCSVSSSIAPGSVVAGTSRSLSRPNGR